MKFGLFGSAQAQRGGPDLNSGQGFRDFIEYNVEAEALGYDSSFVVEHHFTGFGQVSASLNLLTWVAARTATLRLGTAVIVLPWHNPVLLAEQAATIDLLSGGRLEFGVGRGYRHNEFASFCIPIEEAEERFEESLALIVKSWTSEQRFSHHGKFWHFEDIVVEPPTRQKPHPPIWMAAGNPDSIRKVARRGAKLLLDQFASTALTIERFNIYKTEVEADGPALRPDGCRRVPRLLCGEGRRRQGEGGRGAARQPAAHEQARGHAGRDGAIQHAVVRPHARRGGGKRDVRHAGRDRQEARHAAGRRRRAGAAQRPGRIADQSAPLRARGDAGLCGQANGGRGVALGAGRSPGWREAKTRS